MEPVGANIQNDHDHGPEKRSFPAAVASAVINHMLMQHRCTEDFSHSTAFPSLRQAGSSPYQLETYRLGVLLDGF